jgi:hypothetical protein
LNYLGMTIQVLEPILQTATEQHRAGNLLEARRLYEQVLSVAPLHELALFRSGLLELQDAIPIKPWCG